MSDHIENGDFSEANAERDLARVIQEKLPDRPVEPAELAKLLAAGLSLEVRRLAYFQGPLPPPQMLKEYEEVLPGSANRIIERAEKEQSHRHSISEANVDLEHKALKFAAIRTFIGQGCAFILSLVAIGGGACLIANGENAGGIASIIGALAALTTAFIVGKVFEQRSQSNREADKPDPA